jgi:CheY-like chemotaxis protein
MDFASKDVLVVDDDRDLCDLIADVLEAEGYRTRKAANGLEALERIQESKPHLILLDLMMPVMSGWQVVEKLKSEPEWARIPLVIITADYEGERKREALGARAVITKPFDIDHLAQVVRYHST